MNWISEQNPALTGIPYGPTTPHIFWDGRYREHDGMGVKGMPMAPKDDLDDLKRKFTAEEALEIRRVMKEKGVTQLVIADILQRAAGTISHVLNLKAHLQPEEILTWKEYLGVEGD